MSAVWARRQVPTDPSPESGVRIALICRWIPLRCKGFRLSLVRVACGVEPTEPPRHRDHPHGRHRCSRTHMDSSNHRHSPIEPRSSVCHGHPAVKYSRRAGTRWPARSSTNSTSMRPRKRPRTALRSTTERTPILHDYQRGPAFRISRRIGVISADVGSSLWHAAGSVLLESRVGPTDRAIHSRPVMANER